MRRAACFKAHQPERLASNWFSSSAFSQYTLDNQTGIWDAPGGPGVKTLVFNAEGAGLSPGFPGGSDGKASVYNVGDLGLIPGSGRFPGEGNGNPLQYSCLENPMEGGAWCRLLSVGSQRVGHNWATSLSLWGIKILHASLPPNQNINSRSNTVTNSIKTSKKKKKKIGIRFYIYLDSFFQLA